MSNFSDGVWVQPRPSTRRLGPFSRLVTVIDKTSKLEDRADQAELTTRALRDELVLVINNNSFALDQRLQKVEGDHVAIDDQIRWLKEQLESLAQKLTSLSQRVDGAAATLGDHANGLNKASEALESHGKALDAHQTTLSDHATRISGLESWCKGDSATTKGKGK